MTGFPLGALRILPAAAMVAVLSADPAWVQESGSREGTDRDGATGTEALGVDADGFLAEDGQELYLTACAGCHQPQGEGAVGAGTYPPLAGNPTLEGGRYPAWIVLHGMGAMPSFGDWLDNEQIVAVVGYIQQNLGNRFEPTLEPADVEDLRETSRPGP